MADSPQRGPGEPPASSAQLGMSATANGVVHDGLAAPAEPAAPAPVTSVPEAPQPSAQHAVPQPPGIVPAPDLAQADLDPQAAIYAPAETQPRHGAGPEAAAQPTAAPRRRRATKRRLPTQRIFSDLASQAAIPSNAYAIGEDVDGAMCLVRSSEGYEVFNSAAGARHEVRIFQDEESAYFYLFGVLVADAVRTGALAPRQ